MKRASSSFPMDGRQPQRGSRDVLSARQASIFRRVATADGKVDLPSDASRFAESSRSAYRYREEPISDEELPNWVRAHVEKSATIDELLVELRRRLLRAPTEEHLHLALAVANEVARRPEGARIVRRHLSQELVDSLTGSHPSAEKAR